MGCPAEVTISKNLVFSITTHDPDTGVVTDADSAPIYRVYEDETGTAIKTGTMTKLDDTNTTGFYTELLSCTTDNGYEADKTYTIYISATVDSDKGSISYGFRANSVESMPTPTSGALTSTANFKSYADISHTDDDTLIGYLISRATSAIENYCDKTLTSTTYREFYDGSGDTELVLNQYPISAVTLVSTSRQDVIRIKNENSDAYNAYVTVDDTYMYLVVMGGTNAGTDTLTLASYTVTELVAAINALTTGWTAYNDNTLLGVWESIEVLPCEGLEALASNTYVQIPYEPLYNFKVYKNQGTLHYSGKFPLGHQNIIVKYTAGYSTMPADLEQICIDLAMTYYKSRNIDTSVAAEKLGDHYIKYVEGGGGGARDIPTHIAKRLAPYMKWRLAV